jgi:hypothetical protein
VAANLLRQQFNAGRGLQRISVQELWHVDEIAGWDRSTTSTAVLAQVPVAEGSSHPDPSFAAAKCVFKGVARQLSPTEAFVLVVYDSDIRWGALPRSGSRTLATNVKVQVPAYKSIGTGDGGRIMYILSSTPYEKLRGEITVYEERFTGTDAVVLRPQIIPNVGKRYTIGGTPFLLKDFSIDESRTGQSRIVYQFVTRTPMASIPADPSEGLDLTVPALSYLDEWYAPAEHLGAGAIRVRLAAVEYAAGGTLPSFP